jgi:hypothetical protein
MFSLFTKKSKANKTERKNLFRKTKNAKIASLHKNGKDDTIDDEDDDEEVTLEDIMDKVEKITKQVDNMTKKVDVIEKSYLADELVALKKRMNDRDTFMQDLVMKMLDKPIAQQQQQRQQQSGFKSLDDRINERQERARQKQAEKKN